MKKARSNTRAPAEGPGYWKLHYEVIQDSLYTDIITHGINTAYFAASSLDDEGLTTIAQYESFKAHLRRTLQNLSADYKRRSHHNTAFREARTRKASKLHAKLPFPLPDDEPIILPQRERFKQASALITSLDVPPPTSEQPSTQYQTSDPQVMLEIFHELYSRLYNASDCPSEETINSYLRSLPIQRLSEEEKMSFLLPTDTEAMEASIRAGNRQVAPGPDGIPLEFYLRFSTSLAPIISQWAIMASKVGYFGSPAETYTRVIPKSKGTTDPQNFRPLSLMNVDLKVVLQALNTAALKTTARLIAPGQTGFLPGRSVLRNVAMIRMAIDQDRMDYETCKYDLSMSKTRPTTPTRQHRFRNNPQRPNFLSLDFEKAYDRPSHPYILAVLKEMNFPNDWIAIINASLSRTSSRILLNGYLSASFATQTGMRQGDPLSLLLYALMMEPLLIGIRTTQCGPVAHHLATASRQPIRGGRTPPSRFSVTACADDVVTAWPFAGRIPEPVGVLPKEWTIFRDAMASIRVIRPKIRAWV